MEKALKRWMLMLCALIPLSVAAQSHYDVEQDGVYYRVWSNGHATVIFDASYKNMEVIEIAQQVDGVVVDSIGAQAFKECKKLKQVTMPETLRSINKQAFRDCQGLTSFTIPASVRNLEDEIFHTCSKLKTVTVENGPSYISYSMFMNCYNLEQVTLAASVHELRNKAFMNCNSIKKFFCLSRAIVKAQYDTFYGSDPFYGVDLSNSQLFVYSTQNTSVEPWSRFGQKIMLDNLDFYDEVSHLYYNIVDNDNHYVEVTTDQDNDYNKYTGITKTHKYSSMSTFYIPLTVTIENTEYTVKGIGEATFKDNRTISHVIIGANVEYIAESAFEGCDNLSSVNMNNNHMLNTIGYAAFKGTKLTTINLPNTDGLVIGDEVFMNCTSLYGVALPSQLAELGEGVFSGCTSLKEVNIPNQITDLGNHLFYECESLTDLQLHSGIKTIGAFTFSKCSSLPDFSLDGIQRLGEQAFRDCRAFTRINIPASMTEIDREAFIYCHGATELTLPDNLQKIGVGAFSSCGKLTEIKLPQALTTVNEHTFENCSEVKYVTIPANVTKIEKAAFGGLNKLQAVYCYPVEAPEAHQNSFSSSSYSTAVLNVKAGSEYSYGNHETWSQFTNRSTLQSSALVYYVDSVQYAKEQHYTGDVITMKAHPVKANHEFSGWDKQLERMPGEDTSVWGCFNYQLSFMVDNDHYVEPEQVFFGKPVQAPACRRDYYHIDWNGLPVTMPAKDTVIVGEYVPNDYQVTYHVTGAGRTGVLKTIMVRYLSELPADPEVEAVDGYRFAWEAHVKEMPHNDITIEGYYTPEVKAKGITYDIELEEGFAIVSSYDSEFVKDTLWVPESVSFQGKSYPVYRIADKVFMDNSTLTTAILSKSVMWIGNDAFRNCRSLADVYVFNVAKPHLVGNPFMDSSYDQGAVLHVPARSVPNYSTAEIWKDFSSIVAIASSTITYKVDGVVRSKVEDMLELQPISPIAYPMNGNRLFSGWRNIPAIMPNHDIEINGAFEYQVTFSHSYTDNSDPKNPKPVSEVVESKNYFYGDSIKVPVMAERENYTFVWENHAETMPAEDITILGSYVANEITYQVTFKVDGEVFTTLRLPKDANITMPEVPEKPKYRFVWDEHPTTMPDHDIIIEGSYTELLEIVQSSGVSYRVHVVSNYAEVVAKTDGSYQGHVVVASEVTYGDTTYPVTTIGAGAFNGSQKLISLRLPASITTIGSEAIANCPMLAHLYFFTAKVPHTDANAFENTPLAHVALHVSAGGLDAFQKSADIWKTFQGIADIKTSNIYYKVDSEAYQTVSCTESDPVKLLAAPVKEGHNFSGWSKAPALMPDHDITIEGRFDYLASFFFDNQNVENKRYYYGDSIKTPEIPVKEGCDIVWNDYPKTMPADDVVITGQYENEFYTLTFYIDDKKVGEQRLSYRSPIELPEVEEREGYTFAWNEHPELMPRENTGIHGYYTQIIETVKVGGVSYRTYLGEKRAEVIADPDGAKYSGNLELSDSIQVNDKYYPVTVISEYAFNGSKQMKSIRLSENLDSIGKQAFRDCQGLTVIVLPKRLRVMADEVFLYCSGLKDVYAFCETVPTTAVNAFNNTKYKDATTLHVPADMLNTYKNTAPWNSFYAKTDIKYSTLTYMVDGETYKTYPGIVERSAITPEPDPEKDGRLFSGWNQVPALMPDSNVVINGGFQYHVNYVFELKSIKKESYFYGDPIKAPEIPDNEGHYAVWDDMPETMPAADITVTGSYAANQYVVTFMVEDLVIRKDTLDYGVAIVMPEVEQRYGYKFSWDEHPMLMQAKNITIRGHYEQRIEDTMADGIAYRVYMVSKRAEVVSLPDKQLYTGNVTISNKVTFDGREYTVDAIASSAFSGSRQLTGIKLPETLQTIGKQAFNNCQKLTELMLPASVDSIADEAFRYCYSLAHVYLFSEQVPRTSSNAFVNTNYKTATTLHVPTSSLAAYKESAPWKDFFSVVDISSKHLTYLVDGQVYKQYGMTVGDPITPEAEPVKDGHVFSGWREEIPATMPDHDVTITGAFNYRLTVNFNDKLVKTENLYFGESIVLPEMDEREGYHISWDDAPETMPAEDLTINGRYAVNLHAVTFFVDDEEIACDTLGYGSAIVLPEVESRPGYSFSWDEHPETMPDADVTIRGYYRQRIIDVSEGGVNYRVYMAEDRAEVVSGSYQGDVVLADSLQFENRSYAVTGISESAFSGSKQLTSLRLPDPLRSIGKQAFRDCQKLSSVKLPKNVMEISDEAFYYCTKLSHVYVFGDQMPQTATNAFSGTNYKTSVTLHVPAPLLNDYKTTAPWKDFKNITDVKASTLTYMVDGIIYKTYTNIIEGDPITPEPLPTKGERRFLGWNDEPTVMPDHDVIVSGGFEYTIQFVFNGQVISTDSYYYGQTISAPTIEEREGYRILWDDMPETMPAEDLTITGQYVINQYRLTFYVDNVIYTSDEVDYGAKITPPAVEPRFGYSFTWDEYPETMPAHDVDVHGQYTARIVDLAEGGVNYRVYMTEQRAEVVKGTYSGELTIVDAVNVDGTDFPVLSIAESAFSGSKQLTGIKLPETLQTIGKQAFRDCQKLTVVKLPASLTDIQNEAFIYCTGLKEVFVFCETVPQTATNAFSQTNYRGVTQLHVPTVALDAYKETAPWKDFYSITDIKHSTLTYMVDGKVYKIFTGITEGDPITPEEYPIKESRLFSGWDDVPTVMPDHDVVVSGGFEYTVRFVFGDNDLQSDNYYYGETVVAPTIEEREGYRIQWDNMPETMPAEDLTVTGRYVINQYRLTFYIDDIIYSSQDVDYGTKITAPTVEQQFGYSFTWDEYPETMPAHDVDVHGYYRQRVIDLVEQGVNYRIYMVEDRAEIVAKSDGSYSGDVTCVASIVFEGHRFVVSDISEAAFKGCKKLTGIVLPDQLQHIGKQAFRDCWQLKAVTLPKTLETIGAEAFQYCTSLATITCLCVDVPDADLSAFNNMNLNRAVLYVPEVSIDLYSTTAPWNAFGSILPVDPTGIALLLKDPTQVEGFYDLNGVRVEHLHHGFHYIVRLKNGTRQKFYFK